MEKLHHYPSVPSRIEPDIASDNAMGILTFSPLSRFLFRTFSRSDQVNGARA